MRAKLTAVAALDLAPLTLTDELENKLRRADLFTRGIVACCHELLHNHNVDGDQTGLFISTAFGPMQCNLEVLDFLVEDEPVSPTLFSHSVFNGASGYLARIFKIRGPAITQTSYSYPFFTALGQAVFAIEQNHLKQAIVIQAETYSQLLEDAKTDQKTEWPTGVVAWLLGQDGVEILSVQVTEKPCSPADRLRYDVISSTGKQHQHPLAMGLELNRLFQAGRLPKKHNLTSRFGDVSLGFGDPT